LENYSLDLFNVVINWSKVNLRSLFPGIACWSRSSWLRWYVRWVKSVSVVVWSYSFEISILCNNFMFINVV
jgi:hypothetical protein